MAKLKMLHFKFESKAGEILEFQSEVTVDSQGVFSLVIPDHLEENSRDIISGLRGGCLGTKTPVSLSRPRTHLRVTGRDLADLERFIGLAAKDFLECEVEEEMVIRFGTLNQVSYWKTPDGNIFPNGYVADSQVNPGEGKGKWHGMLHFAKTAEYFQIGIFARVCRKITYTRESGTKTVYERVNGEEGSYLWKLNSFVGLSTPRAELKEMPYSEESARFFYDTMVGMCHLADRIDGFFGNTEKLNALIQIQAPMLSVREVVPGNLAITENSTD